MEGWYDEQDEQERRPSERAELVAFGTRCASGVLVGLMTVPLWGFGILVFLWKSTTGRMPWGPDQPPPGADPLTVAYLLGQLGVTAIGAALLPLAAAAVYRRVRGRGQRSGGSLAGPDET